MHGENNLGVPAFLAKLWRLVEDAETNELISWSQVNHLIKNKIFFFFQIWLFKKKHI